MDNQKFCLKWNNYQNSVTSVFENLRQDEELVDITLCCEGHKIKAHRMMLSACSPYFRDLLKENPCQHPVFFLKDTSFPDLAAVVEFVYKGEVNVAQSQLGSFLKTAEMLQVRGLTGDDDEEPASQQSQPQASKPSTPRGPGRPPVSVASPHLNSGLSGGRPRPASPPLKRRRLSISPERTGAAPAASLPAAFALAPAPSPAVSLPSALPPPPLSLPLSSAPPPPPHTSASLITAHSELASRAAAERAGAEPPASPAISEPRTPQQQPHAMPVGLQQQRDYSIKVEKVDLPEEDDESLEATFSHVSNFEASQFDGSDHSAGSHDMAGLLGRVSDQGMGDLSAMAGPSEDANSQGAVRHFQCPVCSREYTNHRSLDHHMHVHSGKTTCLICGAVYGRVGTLRNHVLQRHPEAAQLLPQLLSGRPMPMPMPPPPPPGAPGAPPLPLPLLPGAAGPAGAAMLSPASD